MTAAESNIWERIRSLIHRFQNADRIVLGTPMWNFGLPAPFRFAKSQLNRGISTNQLKVQIVRPLHDKAVAMMAVSGLLKSRRAICSAHAFSSGRIRLA